MADVDYGYGDEDYGYGDAAPEDYGYGDAAPEEYGYGDEDDNGPAPKAPEPVAAVDKRPKRRCSVTKFNLDNDSALTAADRIRDMRTEDANVAPPSPQPTVESSDDYADTEDEEPEVLTSTKKSSSSSKKDKEKESKIKKGALNRLRKRLSVAF